MTERPRLTPGARAAWMRWAAFGSVAFHGIAYAALGWLPSDIREVRPQSVVAFQVAAASPPAPPEERTPEPESEPAPSQLPATTPRPERVTRPEAPAPPPAAAAAPEAVDLSGVTLTNALGVGFAMPTGNGQAREGALRVPATLTREKELEPRRPSANPSPLVPLSNLSTRPAPPALDGALARNYPTEARRRGIGGAASVKARIDADGVVRSVVALNESDAGFGEACRRTLRGSRWSPPRDRDGRAVATEVRYTCRFVVTP